MKIHNKNGLAVAKYLEAHSKVDKVFYPGLESHPGHKTASNQMSGFGGMISFEMNGGYEAAKQMVMVRFVVTLELFIKSFLVTKINLVIFKLDLKWI